MKKVTSKIENKGKNQNRYILPRYFYQNFDSFLEVNKADNI
jgi:hypothetical protein